MYLFAKFNIPFFVFLVKLTKFINFIPKIHELILVRFPPKNFPLRLCLFIGAIVAAIIGRVDFGSIAGTFNSSFGSILVSTGILMVFAFTFSQYLNESGGVTEFAKFMVRIVGNKYDLIAMAIVGYILSIPVGLLASCAMRTKIGRAHV